MILGILFLTISDISSFYFFVFIEVGFVFDFTFSGIYGLGTYSIEFRLI